MLRIFALVAPLFASFDSMGAISIQQFSLHQLQKVIRRHIFVRFAYWQGMQDNVRVGAHDNLTFTHGALTT
jgi:hypothetical protein